MQNIFFAFSYQYADANPWYVECLRQSCAKLDCRALIARDIATNTHILNHVADCIDQSTLGFYDITGLNPNVLIEYGLGHNSDKPSFLLLNPQRHTREVSGFMGRRTETLINPTDLDGLIWRSYVGPETLAEEVTRVIDQHLRHPSQEGEVLADRIVNRLRILGTSTMPIIAQSVGRQIEDIRPILKGLVATERVVREGHARGSKYRAA